MKYYETKVEGLRIRVGEPEDTDIILAFIRELAEYEKMEDEVVANRETLYDSLFVKKQAEVILAVFKEEIVGFALYFHNFSTFLGKANLYLEDLFIRPKYRSYGIGKSMLSCLAKIAVERNCERLDWWCLDWNEPSIQFYKKLGANPMSDWTVYRVDGKRLIQLSEEG